jgi:Xaa-Pro aminopeptidase
VKWAERRGRVLEALGERGALLIAAAPEITVGRSTELAYRVDPELYYLTGYTEPEAVLLLVPSAEQPYTLFVRPRDAEREMWDGVRGGLEAARERHGADAAYDIAELAERLPKLLAGADTLHARLQTGRPPVDGLIAALSAGGRAARARYGRGVTTIADPGLVLDEMRLRKDADEIERLRRAARITTEAVAEAVAATRPGGWEYEVQAAAEAGMRRRGAAGPAYPTIAAAGANATVLHYTANEAPLRDGDLLLIDAGAMADMYCADITRTYPIGRWTEPARAIHDAVLAAHDAAIAVIAPGARMEDVSLAAVRSLRASLLALDVEIAEPADDSLEALAASVKPYFPHRVGHWIGLDVHDAGDYVTDDGSRRLEPGMVLTIEPGLYFGPAAGSTAFSGIGVRIEDDVLVTQDGAEVLTAALPADGAVLAAPNH